MLPSSHTTSLYICHGPDRTHGSGFKMRKVRETPRMRENFLKEEMNSSVLNYSGFLYLIGNIQ